MCPEAVVAMLACARIGAIHSVVFAGFSADALTERIQDASSRVVITANEGKRGPKGVPLKKTVDEALLRCPGVQHVLVHRHTSTPCEMSAGRDQWLHTLLESQRPYCPCEWMDSEDGLFILYTSGSTGKPKGVMHTTGGYLTYVSMTHDYVLNLNPDAQGTTSFVYGCVADVGWITGHSYIVYGPLSNGVTTLLFESTPLYPGPDRYWQMVQTHRVNVLYAAPTALRALMKYGNEHVTKWDRSSLKVLGSVGESINPAAWEWFYHVVGEGRCPIVDTYWQTETVRTSHTLSLYARASCSDLIHLAGWHCVDAAARCHAVEAWFRNSSLFWHTARDLGPPNRSRDHRARVQGRVGVEDALALDGAHRVQQPPALPLRVHATISGVLLHGGRVLSRSGRLLLDHRSR